MGTALAAVSDIQIDEIKASVDVVALAAKLKQIIALKSALDSCCRFRENAIRYATLEAAALVRIVELGGVDRIPGLYRKRTAAWLAELTEEERGREIRKCSCGMTIDQIWKRDVFDADRTKQALADLEDWREFAVDTLREHGTCDLKYCIDQVRKTKLPEAVVTDFIDGTRRALRNAGGLGVGDYEYFRPVEEEHGDARIKEAIAIRLYSIAADFEKLYRIIKNANISHSVYWYIAPQEAAYAGQDRPYLIHILKALSDMGAINDLDKYTADIENAPKKDRKATDYDGGFWDGLFNPFRKMRENQTID